MQAFTRFVFLAVVAASVPLLLVVLLHGAEWSYAEVVDPGLRLGLVVFVTAAAALGILATDSRYWPAVGDGLLSLSFLVLLATWTLAATVTMEHVGALGVLLGVMILGIGVIPVSFAVAVFAGEWLVAAGIGALVFGGSLVWLCGLYLISSPRGDRPDSCGRRPERLWPPLRSGS